jgi:hypothetical protein
LLAKSVNDDAGSLVPRVVWTFFASKPAPTQARTPTQARSYINLILGMGKRLLRVSIKRTR